MTEIRGVVPMLQSSDLQRTITFYTEVLGFEVTGTHEYEGELVWCSLRQDTTHLMFFFEGEHDHGDGEIHSHEPGMSGTLYFYPDDADALYETVKDRVEVQSAPQDMPYGMREFSISDPDGYRLSFGSELRTG